MRPLRLERRQAARAGVPVSPPAAVDSDISTGLSGRCETNPDGRSALPRVRSQWPERQVVATPDEVQAWALLRLEEERPSQTETTWKRQKTRVRRRNSCPVAGPPVLEEVGVPVAFGRAEFSLATNVDARVRSMPYTTLRSTWDCADILFLAGGASNRPDNQ